MATIHTEDIVFATLSQRGATIANVCMSGISSMAHLLKSLRKEAPWAMGMAQLSVRNSSQGWTSTQALYLR